ncbi:MAG: hypothetical protein GXO45_03370 [Aquificae bacterium]|nr:hypothetical protein [Aquificota bacterium]
MDKDIKVDLEVLILADGIDTNSLQEGEELTLEDFSTCLSVNRIPFYKGRIKKENSLLLCRITKILNKNQSLDLKEKYLI